MISIDDETLLFFNFKLINKIETNALQSKENNKSNKVIIIIKH
jgi:hypothetical protein